MGKVDILEMQNMYLSFSAINVYRSSMPYGTVFLENRFRV